MEKHLSMSSQEHTSQQPDLVGDFYRGADGPTIILIAESSSGCKRLQDLLRDLGSGAERRMLTEEPEIEIANVDAIEMAVRSDGPRVLLRRHGGDASTSFIWSATPDGWLYLADLIQPLCDGGSGHLYLTENKDDAALIELSVGEDEVLRATRSAQ
jgi:hypothetical protein